MNAATPFYIVVALARRGKGTITAAAGQLTRCMSGAAGDSRDVHVHVRAIGRDAATIPVGSVFLASLSDDVESGESLDQVERDWRTRLARVQDAGHDRILLCTLFRCVTGLPGGEKLLERIRRLNQLVVAFSRDLGCEVADVDRLLALCGGRQIGADYRCLSQTAERLAGHAITAAILDGEMSGYLEPNAQQRAIALHGGVLDLRQIMTRHARGGPA